FHRADGHTVKMPMDNGEGRHWNRSPGNLISAPKHMQIGADSTISISLDKVIPPVAPTPDTKYVRHVRIQSDLLTKFWGRPMHIGAIVVVPEGFDENPGQHYPIAFNQGHFPADFFGFRETPPAPGMKGIERDRAQSAHRFYQDWTAGRLPKMLLVLTQHATPFYDDSYGVNTANAGPYGDALTKELYPLIEKQFRAIGEPWARVLFGGSTGGWMTLAQQIFYPDYFGGAWGFCPDPVDFHVFQLVDVYNDKNAHFDIGPFARTPRPLGRMRDDHTLITIGEASQQELVLGTKGRSGEQMDAFHATFGPVGTDGYPAKLWDPVTGDIDPQVASYWRDNYDLTAYLARDWERLGPKLVGKIHITMGTKDTYYLDAATHRMDAFLESTKLPRKGPYYGGSVQYGNNEPHCYTGVPPGQRTETYYLPIFADHMRKMAPKDADTTSWR
ncbi:MAG: alpha/beta hydrolase-fold protein, partial [Bryobacteraceae bacterium]